MDHIHITDDEPSAIIKNLTETIAPQEAFYLCELDDIIGKYKTWTKLLPRVEPHYAVKCNPHRPVLEVLAALGTGFDCASMEEMRQVRILGVQPDRIIFAHPTKLPRHIKYAKSEGVRTMTFDCEAELEKIKRNHPEARAILRIRYDDPKSHYRLGEKFGCDFRTEAPGLLSLANSLDVEVVGVSFHIGSSSSNNPSIFREAIKACAKVFEIASELGTKLSLLDIGGGLAGEKGTSIVDTAQIINKALADFFPDESVKVISEPGRFFVCSAFTLLANIHTVKSNYEIIDEHRREKRFNYYIDDGVYGSFIAVLCDEPLVGRPLKSIGDGVPMYRSTIWGPTCDPYDKVDAEVMLPEMRVGEWFIFENMGAYTLSISSNFNGFSSAPVHSVITEESQEILHSSIPSKRFINGIDLSRTD